MKCLDVVKEDMQEVGAREDEVFGCGEGGQHEVGAEDEVFGCGVWMQDEVFGCGEGGHAGGRRREVGAMGKMQDEVFGCGEGGHAGGRSEGR